VVNEAVILAGGLGTRMMPANFYCPKEFLPLLGVPVMHHLVWEVMAAGVEVIHIVVSPEKRAFAEQMVRGRGDLGAFLGEMESFHIDPIPEDICCKIHIQEKPLGVGDAISIACGDISGAFLVLLGDNAMIDPNNVNNIGQMSGCLASKILVQRFEETGSPCVGAILVDPSSASNYGIIELENGCFARVIEKPEFGEQPTNLALCGRYVFPKNSSQLLKEVRNEDRLELQSVDFLNELSNMGKVEVVKLENIEWVDAGNIESWYTSELSIFQRSGLRRF